MGAQIKISLWQGERNTLGLMMGDEYITHRPMGSTRYVRRLVLDLDTLLKAIDEELAKRKTTRNNIVSPNQLALFEWRNGKWKYLVGY